MDLKNFIRDVPDFPSEGIMFRDITPLLYDPESLSESINQMEKCLEGVEFDIIAGPESRGFIFCMPLSYKMKKGFIPVRKAGKLPYKTISKKYDLEYGTSTIEIHADTIHPGQKVVIADDLLATGGTCKALCELVEECGGEVVAIVFLIELEALGGRKILDGYNIHSILKY